ncbi:MAG: DUF5371 family protein [Archaeoglobaceae archaeon]
MTKIVHAQTVLAEESLNELKKKTGESATKDAISVAVNHYLRCSYTNEEALEGRLEEIMKKKKR